ncbi:Pkinase-domain-containing protein [Teratosphaeria nubilosa]|uniref:non-specific serine/threonine protein kinase n=1 Tax=Teratosphaeria nubilosa TaxID=161662 RepID=A0A6G1KWZ2_9PEZI|nr:Pkinase-domain-containing protein [Teratosphaeria nubilosa]
MSSAAVQHSTPAQYDGTSGRDRYPVIPAANLSTSPPSSRRKGPSASSNASSFPTSPQPPTSFDSPSAFAAMSTSRGPTADAMTGSTYTQSYPEQSNSSMQQTALPIRSTPTQQSQPATSSSYDQQGFVRPQTGGYGSESEPAGTSSNDSDRRRQSHRSPQPEAPGSGRSQRSRNAPTASRSATAVGQPPVDTSLPRENSAIINHIVVDDPRSDLERERARTYEARPHAGASGYTERPATDHGPPSDHRASAPVQRSRQEHLRQSSHRKEVKFGEYILGQTLGEGEFGKVKMGWKKDSTVQVAIKLIRKESLAGNTTRLPKIYREIAILRGLEHPNIVRLHEFVETERHMGIILEYASGGELFDYILNQRYLRDDKARKLFAQLISGVGYLHKKGIVHRDLKLENLLLDRNKNIIITDFGFANTFDPMDELGEDMERKITDKEYVKREGLDVLGKNNHRRGDLMQTSCGSPCYAAPELVVSDGLYTGRKVDVWSCGVILYAMLAGYLPFDDDPANPEGDNINLLYKYIVSTPLTFPEYVTPHARDLLKRILVPDPRRRADLFEVARHSWLSDYMHVVGFIGSSNRTERDIASSAMRQDEEPSLGRSASVREPSTKSPVNAASMSAREEEEARKQRDAKRRTVQVEYVAPQGATARGDAGAAMPPSIPGPGRTRARPESQGPIEVPPQRKDAPSQAMPPPSRSNRDSVRLVSDASGFSAQPVSSASRPSTGGALGGARLPSRGNSYSQPALATPTTENVQGRFSQPKSGTGYIISSPMPSEQGVTAADPTASNRPVSQHNLNQFQQNQAQPLPKSGGHKRSSTLGSIGDRLLGRSNSRKSSRGNTSETAGQSSPVTSEKRDRRYPPLSMKQAIPNNTPTSQGNPETTPRPSSESKRRPSFSSFMRKNSDAPSQSGNESKRTSRRFSLLPASLSMHNFGLGGRKDYDSDGPAGSRRDSMQQRSGRSQQRQMAFGRGQSPADSQGTSSSTIPLYYDQERESARQRRRSGAPASRGGYDKAVPPVPQFGRQEEPQVQRKQHRDDGYGSNLLDQSVHQQDPPERYYTPNEDLNAQARPGQYQSGGAPLRQPETHETYGSASDGYRADDGYGANQTQPLGGSQVGIRPQQRKFGDVYDQAGHGGSSSGARRVMDFFRRRGKERSQV